MSLVTIQRSQSPTDLDEDSTDRLSDISSVNNLNEDFFASKATVILQNQIGRRRSSVIKEENTLQCNLKKIVELLRKEDSLKLMVDLEKVNWKIDGYRYFCVIARNGSQDTDEHLILGVNVSNGRASIGFVLPIHQDMMVELYGDGGFKIGYKDGEKLFKPTSVHALWATVHMLNKACTIAHSNNYYRGGLNHSWINYYEGMVHSSRGQIAEWNRMLDADTVVNSNLAPQSAIGEFVIGTEMDERRRNQESIRIFLEEIMRDEDMDNVTVAFLREKLQEKVSFKLNDYRSFIAEEILIIYGKMDEASRILPYLYLGSTYNSSNLEELLKNKISHILNVTRESENFFREKFIYKNVEVFDEEETKLLKHFDPCYKFIKEAKIQNGACLVHCQRGISRSASIVISYMMKEANWSLEEAFEYVKKNRDCIRPNDGFLQQLKTYEGILQASSHRYNSKFKNERRDNIKSYPNYMNDSLEKDSTTDFPISSSPTESKRSSYGSVFRSHSKIEQRDTLTGMEEQVEKSNCPILPDDDHLLNANDDFLMYKGLQCCTSNVSDFPYGAESIFKANISPICELKETDERKPNHCIKNENSDDTFQTDLNAKLSTENIPICTSAEKIPCDMLPKTSDSSIGQLETVVIDHQSQRPVKELLNVYRKH